MSLIRRRSVSSPFAARFIFFWMVASAGFVAGAGAQTSPGSEPASAAAEPGGESQVDRRMAVTIDDLPSQRLYPAKRIRPINERILATLKAEKVRSVGFVNEVKLEVDGEVVPDRVDLLRLWLDADQELGNHTYSHADLHHTPLDDFKEDVLRGEAITRGLVEEAQGELRWFRHPYLHSGTDLETKRGLEAFLAEHEYRVAPVTIDNSEWIFASAYDAAISQGDEELKKRIATTYIDHMMEIVEFYEGQSRSLYDREIPQILLLHANDLNGDYLDEVLRRLRERGYRWIDMETALEDPVYDSPDEYVGAGGITWIHRWAITAGVERSLFVGEPRVPDWIRETAGLD